MRRLQSQYEENLEKIEKRHEKENFTQQLIEHRDKPEHRPIDQPLLVILALIRLQSLEGHIGRIGRSDQ